MRKNTIEARRARAHKSLWLSLLESGLTAGLMSMPIMTLFFGSIGMDHETISISQMCFTAILLVLNVPLGYVADKLSRKWANICGDLLHVAALLAYSQINGLWGAIMCESIFGVGAALSQGVDNTLIEHFSEQYKLGSYEHYHKVTSLLREVFTIAVLSIGLLFGDHYRLCIAVSCIPHLIAAILSMFIHDDSPKIKKGVGAWSVVKEALACKELRVRMAALIVSREATHAVIWIFSDMLKAVGVPEGIVALGWLMSGFCATAGNLLAHKFGDRLKSCEQFAIPMIGIVVASVTLGIEISPRTIWLYAIFGMVKGWTGALMLPPVKRCIDRNLGSEKQTTVESLVKTIGELSYIPLVWFIGFAADFELRFGMLANFAIFLPASVIVLMKLRRFCRNESSAQ